MKPILYGDTENQFLSQGYGRLSDAISCSVNEVLNGLYLLTMVYPTNGIHYEDIVVGRIIYAKPNEFDSEQPFRIFKITKAINKKITVEARHISYDLSGYPVAPFSATGIIPALNGLVTHCMVASPFTVWTDVDNVTLAFNLTQIQSFRACLGGVEGSILDLSQCEYEWDKYTVKVCSHRGQNNGVSIRYGKNLEDFSNARSTEEASYTGCVAKWANQDVSVSGDVQYISNAQDFPVQKIFIYDASQDYQEQPTSDDLNNSAREYLSNSSFGKPYTDTVTVSFVQLWQTEEYKNIAPLERVGMGDIVKVVYDEFSLDKKVVEYTYDVLSERYTQMVLGNRRAGFSQTISQPIEAAVTAQMTQAMSTLEGAIQHATQLISGGLGGYVVINTNADGTPNEILIMNEPEIASATSVIRMNMNGIAFSNTGYSGDYTSAFTIDGHLNADTIDVATLNGNRLIAHSVETNALEVNAYNAVNGTISNVVFDGEGMHIARKDDEGRIIDSYVDGDGNILPTYQTLFSENGMRVISNLDNNATLTAEKDTVDAINLTAHKFLRVTDDERETTSRFQGFFNSVHNKAQQGIFWEK